MGSLKTTPLHSEHKRLGARLVEFGGFEMPVQYTSILKEHAAVRETVGVFDVSHMGQIFLTGPHAVASSERLLSCRVADLGVGRVRYGMLCNEEGGVVDDVTVYRVAEDELLICVNASNIDKDRAWIREHAIAADEVDDRSEQMGMLALQGPNAKDLLCELTGPGPESLGRFRFAEFTIGDARALISSTGYTGSPGYELYLDAKDTTKIFRALLDRGEPFGLLPAGLGARDTLRLEAALPLYGQELDDTTSPLEAGLDRFVKREEGGFIGAEAIESRARAGHTRQLVGFELLERGIARHGYPIVSEGKPIGEVTSGAPSPSLGKSIGLGYVSPQHTGLATPIEILVRDKAVKAKVVETPFR